MKDEKVSIIETLEAFFKNREETILAYLFGSFVEDDLKRFHDIDIAVLLDSDLINRLERLMPYGYPATLNAEMNRLLKNYTVDTVILDNAPPLLKKQVIHRGKLIFKRAESDRVLFETTALKHYADTRHIRRIKSSYMKKRIEEGLSAYGG